MSRIFDLEMVKADDIARSLQGFAHLVFLVVTSSRPLGDDDDSHTNHLEVHVFEDCFHHGGVIALLTLPSCPGLKESHYLYFRLLMETVP